MALAARMMGGGIPAGMAAAICGSYASVAALGSTQATGAPINASAVIVTAADGTKGVTLPATAGPGESLVIFNNSASTLKVYPPSGAAISVAGTGLGSANTAFSQLTYKSTTYTCFTATQWIAVTSA